MNCSNENKDPLLILTSRFPYPLEKGDKLRAFHQLVELSKKNAITLFAVSDTPVHPEHINIVQHYCKEVVIQQQSFFQKTVQMASAFLKGTPLQVGYFYSPSGKRKVKQLLKENNFKHIYCQLIRMSEYVKNEHLIPKTIDYMDALSAGVQRRVNQQPFYKKWLFKMEAKRLLEYETHIFDYFEHRTIISTQDRDLIRHPEAHQIHCIPNGISDLFFENLKVVQDHDFVFVGNMSYAPNVEAVQFIHANILPHFPGRKLLVSGSTPHPRIKKLASQSSQITLTGWVEDIRTSYLRGKVFLAPMVIGTGMQNKLLEAMALGIPCITTALANNAIRATHGKEILVSVSDEDFVTAIHTLLDDQKKYDDIRKNAQKFVKENYSWESSTSRLVQLISNQG